MAIKMPQHHRSAVLDSWSGGALDTLAVDGERNAAYKASL
jgi:hypothetical protein